MPGQPDRAKAGLPRAFDDFLETPTYLFVRGDEASPDKARPLDARDSRRAGRRGHGSPRSRSRRRAACPDKREFVIREAVEAAERAVVQARAAADAARKRVEQADAGARRRDRGRPPGRGGDRRRQAGRRSSGAGRGRAAVEALAQADRAAGDRRGRDLADSALALAEARQSALKAVLTSSGWRTRGPRRAAPSPGPRRPARPRPPSAGSQSSRPSTTAVPPGGPRPRPASLDGADRRPRTEGRRRQGRSREGRGRLVEARADSPPRSRSRQGRGGRKAPLTTAYTPRPLEFHRAKTTYRDTPSNAPYPKVSTGRRLALARWIVDRENPLTARVAVNHIWARHFGEPLVGSDRSTSA